MNEPSDRGFVELADGGRLAYALRGTSALSAAPILLFRPLGGTIALWGAFEDLLARDFKVLTFDYRGMGESSPAPLRVTTRALAEDALKLIELLKIERVNVFGISLGAMAAMWLAGLAPGRISRLCLASAAVRGRSLLGRDFGQTLRMAGCFARRASHVEPCLVRHVLSPQFQEGQPKEVERILTLVSARPTPPFTLLKNTAAAMAHDATELLPTLRVPTLVLAGADDHLLGTEGGRQVADAIPGAGFEIVPAVGHDLTLEAPLRTAVRVVKFFSAA